MIVFGFSVKNMRVEKRDVYIEITKRGALKSVNDDKVTYLPKDVLNKYRPFSLCGNYVVVFEDDFDYNLDDIHNHFIYGILRAKEYQLESEVESHNIRMESIKDKIKYFTSNLKR